MANKTKVKKTKAMFPPVPKAPEKLTRETTNRKQEKLSEIEMDGLHLSNIYLKPIPTAIFTLNVRIKAISQGHTKLFPSEYE